MAAAAARKFWLRRRKQVPPGFEPRSQESEPWVITNYTMEPHNRKKFRGASMYRVYMKKKLNYKKIQKSSSISRTYKGWPNNPARRKGSWKNSWGLQLLCSTPVFRIDYLSWRIFSKFSLKSFRYRVLRWVWRWGGLCPRRSQYKAIIFRYVSYYGWPYLI